MFVILHSGQTGVERGAHDAALAAGFRVAGYMAATGRDELGVVPDHVACHLKPADDGGPRAAIRANLELADAAMVVVPKATTADVFPAMDWIVRGVRRRSVPFLICDPETSVHTVAGWGTELRERFMMCRLFVSGPRATRWPDGEDIARRLIRRLALLE